MITTMITAMIMKRNCGTLTKIALATALLSMVMCLPVISGVQQRLVKLSYNITIENIPEEAEKVNVWMPIPLSNSVQNLEELWTSDNVSYVILIDKEYNNRFLYVMLSRERIKGSELSFTVDFRVDRKSYEKRGLGESDGSLERFLKPDELVPVDGKIAEEARSVVGDVIEPSQQARLLFDHIVDSVSYDKSGTGWGRGDAIYACDVRTGNCTDFHSLFIGEARSLKIPARFIIGFPLPPDAKSGTIKGYHCWGEFYIEGEGWIPIDASEARKHLDRRNEYFRNLDANRVSFTLGRDIRLPRAQSNRVKNYVIYPYAEIDGKEVPVKWQISFEDQ